MQTQTTARQCAWCDLPATHSLLQAAMGDDLTPWTDYACDTHTAEYGRSVGTLRITVDPLFVCHESTQSHSGKQSSAEGGY